MKYVHAAQILAIFPPADAVQLAVGSTNVTNHFALPGDGMLRDKSYSNTTGQPATTQAFLTSGLMPITTAMRSNGFAFSVDGAAPNWAINAARVNFYSAATASGNFVSSVTSGVTLSGDLRTLTVAAGSIPGSATHFGTNLKWAQGVVSLVYASTNVIPVGAETALAAAIMVNSGTSAVCLTDVGAAGTSESVSAAPVLAAGEFIVCDQGYSTYIRKPWQTGKHIVQKVTTSPESHDYNNTYQFNSVVEIADTVPAPSTPGAFNANYSVTGANATTYAVQSDCHPAYKLNGMFNGGKHGVISSYVTATAHGKTNVDRGSICAVSGTHYMITGVYNANHLFLTALNTGTATHWSIDSTLLTSGTATHVSGATHTGDFTITAGVTAYLNPGTRILSNKVWLEGGRALTANGAYIAKLRIQEFVYDVPNAAAVLDYIAANVGSSADLNYNDPSIAMQFRVRLRWVDDAYASTVFHEVTALQDYHCDFSWPTQWQAINARSSASETLWAIVPGTTSCAAGITHTGGSAKDFSSFQNMTGNALEYYHDASTLAPAAHWSDNVQRPSWIVTEGVKDSGGNWLRKFNMARSFVEGWTATGLPSLFHLWSGPNKAYAATRYNEDVTAGDARTVVASYGFTDPAFDVKADINHAAPLGDGRAEWKWSAAEAVNSYTVPIPANCDGKQKNIIWRNSGCTVTVNDDRTVTVTTTGQGQGFVALAY